MPFFDFWRNKSITGLGRHWGRQEAEYTVRRMIRHVTPLRHVVEIGPGRGAFMAACLARGLKHTAIDANLGFLQALERGRSLQAFAPPLPLADCVADAVVANHVIEHNPHMLAATAMLAEMARITRPGGVVILTAPDLLWYGNYFWDCDYSHNFPTSARRLQQMMLDQGLEVALLEYVYNHITGPLGALAARAAWAIPYGLPGAEPGSPFYIDQIYKSRLTFARAVFIIGRRPLEAP
jgi:SAM-dependent methyltransferase